MREWPLLLVIATFYLGAAARIISVEDFDTFAAVLANLGSAAFGAWLYAIGRKDG